MRAQVLAEAVEECRVWLLKQKQTQDWKTTKATADAVYGLLLRGMDILASDELVEVTLADKKIEPEAVEAGAHLAALLLEAGELGEGVGVLSVAGGVQDGYVRSQLGDRPDATPPVAVGHRQPVEEALVVRRGEVAARRHGGALGET